MALKIRRFLVVDANGEYHRGRTSDGYCPYCWVQVRVIEVESHGWTSQ